MGAVQFTLFPDTADDLPDVTVTRCRPGDLWQLGRHRLLCGDSTEITHVERLQGDAVIDSCITDPPYGNDWDTDYRRFTPGGVHKWNRSRKNQFRPIAGDVHPYDPRLLLSYRGVVIWGANHFANQLPAGSLLVWDKRHKNGRSFLSDGEVAWMNRGRGVYIFTHMWQGLLKEVPEQEYDHPTQKPVRLLEWSMKQVVAGDNVYDPFLGSGTTLIACERTGRTCYGMEIEPHYCDVILSRWEKGTGQVAQLLERQEAA